MNDFRGKQCQSDCSSYIGGVLPYRPCQFYGWDKLDGWDWSILLAAMPQFADKCDWDKLEAEDWDNLLHEQPQFAEMKHWVGI